MSEVSPPATPTAREHSGSAGAQLDASVASVASPAHSQILTLVAPIVALVTGAAYLAGWAQLSAYFRGMGAGWYLPSLSSTRVMQQGAESLSLVVVGAYIAWTSMGGLSIRSNRLWSKGILFAGAALEILGLSLGGLKWIEASSVHLLAVAGVSIVTASAGGTLASLVWNTVHTPAHGVSFAKSCTGFILSSW